MVLNHKQLAESRSCSERHPVLCSTSKISEGEVPKNSRSERSIGHEELRENITNMLDSLDSYSELSVSSLQKNVTETRIYIEEKIDDLANYMANTELTEVDCKDLLNALDFLAHLVVKASNGSDAKHGHNRLSLRVLRRASARSHTWSAYHATAASYTTVTLGRTLPPEVRAVTLYSAALVPAWSPAVSPCPAINSSSTLVSDVTGAMFVDASLGRVKTDTVPHMTVTLSHRAARILQLPTCAFMVNENDTRYSNTLTTNLQTDYLT